MNQSQKSAALLAVALSVTATARPQPIQTATTDQQAEIDALRAALENNGEGYGLASVFAVALGKPYLAAINTGEEMQAQIPPFAVVKVINRDDNASALQGDLYLALQDNRVLSRNGLKSRSLKLGEDVEYASEEQVSNAINALSPRQWASINASCLFAPVFEAPASA